MPSTTILSICCTLLIAPDIAELPDAAELKVSVERNVPAEMRDGTILRADGKWESFLRFETHDAEDGYDTVEWAAKLPGPSGKTSSSTRASR